MGPGETGEDRLGEEAFLVLEAEVGVVDEDEEGDALRCHADEGGDYGFGLGQGGRVARGIVGEVEDAGGLRDFPRGLGSAGGVAEGRLEALDVEAACP